MPRKRIDARTKIIDPWKALSSAISDTLAAKESDLRLTMVMQACNDLVSKRKFNQIYQGLHDLMRAHFKEWHNQLLNVAGDPLLTKLNEQYDYLKKYCVIIPTFYSSFDQHFHNEVNKVLNSIRQLYIIEILSDDKLFKKAVTPSILEVIQAAQKGSDIDLSKVANIIDMYYSFSSKNDKPDIFLDFFDKFKQQENDFCDTFYDNNFETSSFTTYLMNTSKQYRILHHILNEKRLLRKKEANEILIGFNISLLQSKEDKFLTGDDLRIAEALMDKELIPLNYLVKTYIQFNFDIEPLYTSCAEYIKNEMLKRTQDFQRADKILSVGSLIELVRKCSAPYKKIFNNKKALAKLDEKIREAWNDPRFNICVTFNDYVDSLIIAKFRGYDFNEQLEIIPQFYQYLDDKAKFHLYYEASFVRRLIRMRSYIEQYDYPIINNIQKISTDFMRRLDTFKKALSDSDQLIESFKAANNSYQFEMEPFIFDINAFPLPKDQYDCIPSMAVSCNSDFKNFYKSIHKKKSLTLIYQGSSVEFTLKFPALRNKTFTITTDLPCGLVISLLIEKPYKYKFKDIVNILNNQRSVANKVIEKLYTNVKLIVPTRPADRLDDDVEFEINRRFNHSKPKLIIPPVMTGQWRSHLPREYEIEKEEAIKSAIVRVLKQRQTMEMDELEMLVIEKLNARYNMTAEMVRRSASLIEGQYIVSRVEDGKKIINYIG